MFLVVASTEASNISCLPDSSCSAPRQPAEPPLSSASPLYQACCCQAAPDSHLFLEYLRECCEGGGGASFAQEVVLIIAQSGLASPKMGIMTSGNGYLRISHVVLYLG